MKKFLAIVLMVALLLTLLPNAALAVEFDEAQKDEMKEMLMNYLTTGTTGNFIYDRIIRKYMEEGTTGITKLDEQIKKAIGDGDYGVIGKLAWMLDTDGKLRIFGSGNVPNYTPDAPAPWSKHAKKIKVISIEGDIPVIGTNAFANCTNAVKVTIHIGVEKLSNSVFAGCKKLENVVFEGDMPAFADDVFTGVTANGYYPKDNATWVGMGNYGGSITWLPMTDECIHEWGNATVTSATCTENGANTFTCALCNETKKENIPATGHTEVIDAGKEATCTEDGLTEGKHCSVCNEVLVAQELIPALGHEWSGWVTTIEPTEETEGEAEHNCKICGKTETKVLPKKPAFKPGDVNGDGKLNAKDATAILKKIVGKLDNAIENFDLIADVNKDGKVNAKDATKILKTIVGKDSIEGWN